MAADVPKALGALLDGLSVTAGGATVEFTYYSWGRHLDAPGNIVTSRMTSVPRPSDVGPDPDYLTTGLVDVHLFWEDSASLSDPEALWEGVENAVKAIIGDNPRPTAQSLFMGWAGTQNLTGFIQGTRKLAYHMVIQVHVSLLEEV